MVPEESSGSAPAETIMVRRTRPLGWRIAKWAAIVLVALVALAAAFLLWLNTESGHRFIVARINAMETTTGLKIRVERIEGSIYGRLTLHNVAFVDAGQVTERQYPDFSDMRFGVGVGGRVYTSFGPVRLDVATPIGRRQGEALINVYVSIGQAF